jgi:deoxyribonuclease-4
MATMLPDGRRLGAHLPLGGGMVKAADRAAAIGAAALQIFIDNPTAWRRRTEPPAELAAFRARTLELGIHPVAVHAPYLINLACPDDEVFERSIGLLASELRTAPTFGAGYVNVHIGSHRGAGVPGGIERVAEGVARALAEAAAVDAASDDPPAMVVLENSAGSGWGLGVDLDELAAIAEAIARRGVTEDQVGFCLDTAHAWGAGIDLSSPGAVDAFLEAADARLGRRRLVLVHLNDSRAELGSRLDRHEHLGAGRIGEAGLGHLLRHPLLAGATFICETPGMDEGYDAVNLARARALAAGRTLDPLPPEAFELGGSSRARTAPA